MSSYSWVDQSGAVQAERQSLPDTWRHPETRVLYLNLRSMSDAELKPLGWYPDALDPLGTCEEYAPPVVRTADVYYAAQSMTGQNLDDCFENYRSNAIESVYADAQRQIDRVEAGYAQDGTGGEPTQNEAWTARTDRLNRQSDRGNKQQADDLLTQAEKDRAAFDQTITEWGGEMLVEAGAAEASLQACVSPDFACVDAVTPSWPVYVPPVPAMTLSRALAFWHRTAWIDNLTPGQKSSIQPLVDARALCVAWIKAHLGDYAEIAVPREFQP